MMKFRTMLPADPSHGLADDAARMTPFGAILRSTQPRRTADAVERREGRHVSLVGPRPLFMQYLDAIHPGTQARRHEVRPGFRPGWPRCPDATR